MNEHQELVDNVKEASLNVIKAIETNGGVKTAFDSLDRAISTVNKKYDVNSLAGLGEDSESPTNFVKIRLVRPIVDALSSAITSGKKDEYLAYNSKTFIQAGDLGLLGEVASKIPRKQALLEKMESKYDEAKSKQLNQKKSQQTAPPVKTAEVSTRVQLRNH